MSSKERFGLFPRLTVDESDGSELGPTKLVLGIAGKFDWQLLRGKVTLHACISVDLFVSHATKNEVACVLIAVSVKISVFSS